MKWLSTLLLLGTGLLAAQDLTDIHKYELAVVQAPGDPMALYNLGLQKYRIQKFEDAKFLFERACDGSDGLDQEQLEQAQYYCGNSAVKLKEYQEAIDWYGKLLVENPDNSYAQSNRDYSKRMLEQQQNDQEQEQQDQQGDDKSEDQDGDGDKKDDQKQNGNQDSKSGNDSQDGNDGDDQQGQGEKNEQGSDSKDSKNSKETSDENSENKDSENKDGGENDQKDGKQELPSELDDAGGRQDTSNEQQNEQGQQGEQAGHNDSDDSTESSESTASVKAPEQRYVDMPQGDENDDRLSERDKQLLAAIDQQDGRYQQLLMNAMLRQSGKGDEHAKNW
jgi:Ca-activated chloride channel homolog